MPSAQLKEICRSDWADNSSLFQFHTSDDIICFSPSCTLLIFSMVWAFSLFLSWLLVSAYEFVLANCCFVLFGVFTLSLWHRDGLGV